MKAPPLRDPVTKAHRRLMESVLYFCTLLAMPIYFLAPHIWKESREDALAKHRLRAERITNSINRVVEEYERRYHADLSIEALSTKVIDGEFRGSVVNATGSLIVRRGEEVVRVFPPSKSYPLPPFRRTLVLTPATTYGAPGQILFEGKLTHPLEDYTLTFTATAVPESAASRLARIDLICLLLICICGPIAIYRSGAEQVRLVAQQQRFLSAVSHELRTPVAGLRMCAELLRNRWINEEHRQEYLDNITREAERLGRLTDNVLLLARAERGRALDTGPVELSALFERVRETFRSPVNRDGMKISFDLPTHLASSSVNAHEELLTQVLINLVENGMKHGCGVTGDRVTLQARRYGTNEVELMVRDRGPGIPEEEIATIFDPFKRGKEAERRGVPGLGLGLAFVRELLGMMRASIRVERLRDGTAFVVRLSTAGS